MAKRETKRQHYVPRSYLKNFGYTVKKSTYIHAAPKSALTEIITPNLTNVCVEKDIYTLTGNNESERQALELFYSEQIEDNYDRVYKILTDDRVVEINEETHALIVLTVITMMYRTAKWIHTHNNLIDEVLSRMFEMCSTAEKDYFYYEDEKIDIRGKTLEEVQKDFKSEGREGQVIAQLEVAMKLYQLRKFDGIQVVKLEVEHELITSDNPVIYYNPYDHRIKPFDPENTLSLPLDKNHIVRIMPHSLSTGDDHFIDRLSKSSAMSIGEMIGNNGSLFLNSLKYVFGSEKGLKNYQANKEKYETPLI
jgi:hypothetical protein